MTTIKPALPSELDVLADLKERVRILEAGALTSTMIPCCSNIIPPLAGSASGVQACWVGQRYGDFSVNTNGRYVHVASFTGDPEEASDGEGGIPNICAADGMELWAIGGLYSCTGMKPYSTFELEVTGGGNTGFNAMVPAATPQAGYMPGTDTATQSSDGDFGGWFDVDLVIDTNMIWFAFTMTGHYVFNFVWYPIGYTPSTVLNDSIVNPGTGYGDTLYWNGMVWAALAIGTAGQVLTVSGGGLPSWA